MKNIRNAVYPLALVMLMALAWMNVFTSDDEDEKLFNEYYSTAQMNEEKKAYITAAEWYVKAAEIKPDDEEIILLAAENFKKCGENTKFLSCCEKASENSTTAKPWILMGRYYLDNGRADDAVNVLSGMPESLANDETDDLMREAKSCFQTGYRSFTDAKPFRYGYFAACDGKLWGLVDEDSHFCIEPSYDAVGAYDPDADVVPVLKDGIWSFLNQYGQRRFALSDKYTFLGSFGGGLAPFCLEGKYGYTDLDYRESDERFDFAGSFSDGAAAVKKNGKWALIGSDLTMITEYVFDEIILDGYGFCSHDGIIKAVKDGKEIFINTNGAEVPEQKKFSCGLAPFEAGNGQGYVNEKGDTVIEPYFDEVTAFSSRGMSLVKEDGFWKVLTLDAYR